MRKIKRFDRYPEVFFTVKAKADRPPVALLVGPDLQPVFSFFQNDLSDQLVFILTVDQHFTIQEYFQTSGIQAVKSVGIRPWNFQVSLHDDSPTGGAHLFEIIQGNSMYNAAAFAFAVSRLEVILFLVAPIALIVGVLQSPGSRSRCYCRR